MAPTASLTFDEIWNGWAKEIKPAAKTLYAWKRVFLQFYSSLGEKDPASTTTEDLIRWKDALVSRGLSSKTIRDGKLAPVRAILQWAADNQRIPTNPAARVVIDVRKKPAEKKRSFSDAEARLLLEASRREEAPARRWIPWLCAYSGARLAEISQLRKQDIAEFEGVWCIRIAPEAGQLKNSGSERLVPVHSALIAAGFLNFAKEAPDGPLFRDIVPDRFGSRGGNATKVFGKWVRALGLIDPRLSPSHSWRHRFMMMHRRYGLALDHVYSMTGHARRNVGDSYGEFPPAALQREIEKIPAIWIAD